jgi:hypothetical protein
MPRGQQAQLGDTMINANGYSHTRTETGWRLTHHLVAEAMIGRAIDSDKETVRFKDGNRANLDPSNIVVEPKKTKSASARLAKLIAQRAEIDAMIQELQS